MAAHSFGLHSVAGLIITAVSLLCGAAFAADHVLIMTISNYATQPLPGVKFDADNALRIAKSLGYETGKAHIYKDNQLTSQGLKDAIGQVPARIQKNDRVFIYYSGHGFSQQQGAQCVQTLVGQDGVLVSTNELNAQLDGIKNKTSDVFVFIDACHSGGLGDMAVTRSVADAKALGSSLSGKVFQAKAGESCANPANFSKAWDMPASMANARAVFPQNNFTFVAAAGEREVALDDNARGGLATVSLLRCLDEGVPDLDGSQAISPKELIACAQKKITADVPALNAVRGTHWMAHTMEGHGNVDRALMNVKAVQINAPAGGAPTQQTPSGAGKISEDAHRTLAAFNQIAAGSNGNWAVSVDMPSPVKMGAKAPIRYSTTQPGFLSILYVGSDGIDIKGLAANVAIEKTEDAFLGNIPIVDCPGGCAGDNTFLFLFSARQLDISGVLNSAKAGGKYGASGQVLSDLQCEAGKILKRNAGLLEKDPSAENLSGCPQKRNALPLEMAKGASVDGYAARVVVVRGY